VNSDQAFLTGYSAALLRKAKRMSDIERRLLGRTGLSVTTLGFGAMDLGGPPAANEISDDEANQVLNAVLDTGINFIDTAVCYGTSEARIGRAIHTGARNSSLRLSVAACRANPWASHTSTTGKT
jgi:aryl-alcohol dehydrogenase-like predicted oxidoreductase